MRRFNSTLTIVLLICAVTVIAWAATPTTLVGPAGRAADVDTSNRLTVAAAQSGTWTVTTSASTPTTLLADQQAVTATAAALPDHACKVVCVQHLDGGSQTYVYVGASGVTTSSGGAQLQQGQALCGPAANTNIFYVVAGSTGSTVGWTCFN